MQVIEEFCFNIAKSPESNFEISQNVNGNYNNVRLIQLANTFTKMNFATLSAQFSYVRKLNHKKVQDPIESVTYCY